MLLSQSARSYVLAFFFIFLSWGTLFRQVWVEWSSNPQYEYGFLLPFLLLILLVGRWDDRPSSQESLGLAKVWLPLLVCPLVIFNIVWYSSPDWRAIYWLSGLNLLFSTSYFFFVFGGFSWAKHFFSPFVLLLFGIPWPSFLELELTNSLMRFVVVVAVEFLSFLGIYARSDGNVIHLRDGLVGVEEACSGIQSLQFAMMSVWFLSELFRRSSLARVVLFCSAIVLAIFVNVARAVSLTLIHQQCGSKKVGELHDTIGYCASLLIFLILFGITYERRKGKQVNNTSSHHVGMLRANRWIVCTFLIVLFSYLAPELWFRWRSSNHESSFQAIRMNWNQVENVQRKDIPEATEAILRYSSGERMEWIDPRSRYWIAFFLEWKGKKVSSFASVHNPENCLPAAGWVKEKSFPLRYLTIDQWTIPWQSFQFRSPASQESFFVFFAVWDDRAAGVDHIAQDYRDRILDAWKGIRIGHRQSLEFVLFGETDLEQAWRGLEYSLHKTVQRVN